MFADIMTIISKELARVFTDKKLVFTTFILPALSLVLIYSVMGLMIQNTMSDQKEHLSQITVVGAPESFTAFAVSKEAEYNIKVKMAAADQEEALKAQVYDGKLDALIVFDTVFDNRLMDYKLQKDIPNVGVFYNPTEDYSGAAYNKITGKILPDYEKQILVTRFGNADYLEAFTLNAKDEKYQLAPAEKISGDVLGGLVPFLLSIFLFSGGMGVGIDIITGEKERGTMATMLVTPVKRESIAFGKMLSLGIISLISTASSLVGMVVAYPFLQMAFPNDGEGAGKGPDLFMISPTSIFQFFILAILLTLIYVGIICMVSVYANSIKEAGTLITPAYMAVMVLGVVSMFTSTLPPLWVFATPVYGTLMGMKHALSAELTWTMFGLNILASLCFVGVIIWVIRQMFNSEKIMFGA